MATPYSIFSFPFISLFNDCLKYYPCFDYMSAWFLPFIDHCICEPEAVFSSTYNFHSHPLLTNNKVTDKGDASDFLSTKKNFSVPRSVAKDSTC